MFRKYFYSNFILKSSAETCTPYSDSFIVIVIEMVVKVIVIVIVILL